VYYLLINVLVSACTIIAVLFAWERMQPALGNPPVGATAQPTEKVIHEEAFVATAATSPEAVYESYVVQPGDTLLEIAAQFEVTVEAIMSLNQLTDPDALNVGDVLLIPLLVEATGTPPPTRPGPTGTPLPEPSLGDLGSATPVAGTPILEILTVVGPGDLAEERVVIRQNGEGQVSLQGWQIMDADGNIFVFPQISLFKAGVVTLYTKAGANSVVELYWGLAEAVWESGEVVSLVDPDGNIVAAFQIP